MKKIIIYLLIAATATSQPIYAQNGIGIGTTTPNAKAALDISSTTKGLLIPSMTTAQRGAITSPPNGLMVYDTDRNEFYHSNGGSWSPILNGDYWSRPIASRKRISNLNDSVGIGISSPTEWLDVDGNIRSRNNLLADNNITATGTVQGGALFTTGNLLAVGTGLFNSDLTTNSDLIINNTTATMQLKSSSVNKGFFQLSGDNVRTGTNSGNTTGNFIIRNNGGDRVTVDAAGNMGIGVTDPSTKLDVNGDVNFNGKITSNQTGNEPLTPLCWGMTNSATSGGVRRGTANTSISRIETGHYRITCPGITATSVVVLMPIGVGAVVDNDYFGPDQMDVYTYVPASSSTLTHYDLRFNFIIY
jgi:hypothetical protein